MRMLTREEQLCQRGFCVFYHSYSLPALIYEVQSCLARHIYRLSQNFPPLPRLLKVAPCQRGRRDHQRQTIKKN